MSNKIAIGIVGLVAVISLLVSVASLGSDRMPDSLGVLVEDVKNSVQKLGGSTGIFHQLFHIFGSGVQIGEDGSEIGDVISGTCNLSTKQLPLEASSTDMFYCSVTNVEAGDRIIVTLPDFNAETFMDGNLGGFLVTSATASTTGTIDIELTNLTGVATSSFPLATTSVNYLIFR